MYNGIGGGRMSKPQVHHTVVEELRDLGYEADLNGNFIHVSDHDNSDGKEVNTMDRSERAARKAGKVARTGTDTAKAAGNWMATDGKAHARTAGKAASRFLKRVVRKSIAISKAAKDAYNEVE